MTLASLFAARAASRPDRVAVVQADGSVATFGYLAALSGGVAARMRAAGLGPGDTVLVATPVSAMLYACLAAAWSLGAVVVFPEPATGLKGLRHAARTARPKVLVAPRWLGLLCLAFPELRAIPVRLIPGRDVPGPPLACADLPFTAPALLSFTSGSTGAPKCILRSHGFLLEQMRCLEPLLGEGDADVDLVAFPVFVLANLAAGRASVLPAWKVGRTGARVARRAVRQARRQGCTRMLVQPSVCEGMVGLVLPTALKHVMTGGGPVYPDVLRALGERVAVTAVYGSTEAEPIAHVAASDISEEDYEAMDRGGGILAGRPVPQVDVTLVDHEILVAGDHVNKGYLDPDMDASTKVDLDGKRWHRTGDAGRVDSLGRLWLLGRIEGRAGGLFPFEVEVSARTWPGVRKAALVDVGGIAVLALEGKARLLSDWKVAAPPGIEVRHVRRVPTDRRHGSKVDYVALRTALGSSPVRVRVG